MKVKKNIKSFIREEDGKTIKKSLLMSSLGLVLGFGLSGTTEAGHSSYSNYYSKVAGSCHTNTHSSHSNHSSY